MKNPKIKRTHEELDAKIEEMGIEWAYDQVSVPGGEFNMFEAPYVRRKLKKLEQQKDKENPDLVERARKLARENPIIATIFIAGAILFFIANVVKSWHTIFPAKKTAKAATSQSAQGDNNTQSQTTGNHSPVTNIHEQNVYLHPKDTKDDKNLLLGREQAIIEITRLIEDFDLDIQDYYKSFLNETERITNDFVSKNAGRGGHHIKAHQEHANEGKKYIEESIKKLNRKIEDITLKFLKTTEFKTIPELSKEMQLYDKAVNKADTLVEKFYNIAKSQEVRITK